MFVNKDRKTDLIHRIAHKNHPGRSPNGWESDDAVAMPQIERSIQRIRKANTTILPPSIMGCKPNENLSH
jgi:hypothetical protein